MCASLSACMFVTVCVCIYVCVFAGVRAYLCGCARGNVCIIMCMRLCVCGCMCACACMCVESVGAFVCVFANMAAKISKTALIAICWLL